MRGRGQDSTSPGWPRGAPQNDEEPDARTCRRGAQKKQIARLWARDQPIRGAVASASWLATLSFAPLGLDRFPLFNPRLAPWALVLRRFAAGTAGPVPLRVGKIISRGHSSSRPFRFLSSSASSTLPRPCSADHPQCFWVLLPGRERERSPHLPGLWHRPHLPQARSA
jgi:hypothetical protein